ncbi:hypothetical protein ACFQ88_07780 [Paenibacillus sp. NPDC056579]|uniref:hypothetical protein n=1 Tax=Paenibacillus sp. NPDC056579 TaxID=3345871 RepID=UPI0036B3DD87
MLTKNGVIRVLLGMLLVFTFFSHSSNVFAATVGQQLISPESGWQRFDDKDPRISYCGTWSSYANGDNLYNGSSNYTSTVNDCAFFSFSGTKVRLIADTFDNKTRTAQITIDGIKETFSENMMIKGSTLVYEKTGLSDGIHNVSIQLINNDGMLTIDAIDIESTGSLIESNSGLRLNATSSNNNVVLTWGGLQGATGYEIHKSTTQGGPYNKVTTVSGTTYTLEKNAVGVEYFIIKAIGVNCISNEVRSDSTSPDPIANRALLTITFNTGLEKEYDLSMKEVNEFISWYEGRATSIGTVSYAIDQHKNNIGPFSSRKDYVIFDKILTFEVDEYITEAR